MKSRGSRTKLRKNAEASTQSSSSSTSANIPVQKSWQPKVLAFQGPQSASWLVDSAADVYVCNDKELMTDYCKRPTRIGGSTSDGISTGRVKVKLRLSLENGLEGVILDLNDVYYLPSSLSNLASLRLLNDHDIYHDNKNETLYDRKTKEVLAHAKRRRNSFLLRPVNLSDAAVELISIGTNIYCWPDVFVHQTSASTSKKSLTTWQRRLGHLNFRTLRQYLWSLDIDFTNEPDEIVCNSCQQTKKTKIYNRKPQKRAEYLYQFIHTHLVGLINSLGFGGERYFFIFIEDFTEHTETYNGNKTSNWFWYLKTFHNLAKTRSKKIRPTERLGLDYRSEL